MTDKSKKPITERQAEARRENGRESRGPTSPEGKARSAQNATKHGYYARGLRPIQAGPLRENTAEMNAFVDAFVAELNPGDSVILHQAALDVADKAWRLTRAQRWEAEGYSGADYVSHEAAGAAWLRQGADRDRHNADTVRRFPDSILSDDDMASAICSLGLAVGLSEDNLEWVDDGDRAAMADALTTLIDDHFAGQEEAASFLEDRATDQNSRASDIEFMWRPEVIRREMDGSFARNAERLVSNASREYDRSLRRYKELSDRLGHVDDDQPEGHDDAEPDDGHATQPSGGVHPKPGGGADGAADEFDIWSYMTADDVVEYLSNRVSAGAPKPPPRNEPTEGNVDM